MNKSKGIVKHMIANKQSNHANWLKRALQSIREFREKVLETQAEDMEHLRQFIKSRLNEQTTPTNRV